MPNIKHYDNGLTLVYHQIESAASAAYLVSIPTGIVADPVDKIGGSLLLTDLMGRRAGAYSETEFSDKFDSLGVSHSEAAHLRSIQLSGYCLEKFLFQALDLTKLMITEPYLADQQSLENIKKSMVSEILAIEDEPKKKAALALREKYFPAPYNRSVYGKLEEIKSLTLGDLSDYSQQYLQVKGTVISIVAPYEFEQIDEYLTNNFNYTTSEYSLPEWIEFPVQFNQHLEYNSEQVQIYLARTAPKVTEEDDSIIMKLVDGVLSGGMFGRLFIEVREKRGLCYSVKSRYSAVKEYGQFLVYAGTTTDRASETLKVMKDVMTTASEGITEVELQRVKTDLLSSLVIGREASFSKASSYLNDYKLRGRIRSIQEIKDKVNHVSPEEIQAYLQKNPLQDFSILTLGSQPINE